MGALNASRSVCWYNWDEQIRSMELLLDFDFEWVLPGHSRCYHADSPEAMRREVRTLVERMCADNREIRAGRRGNRA